MVGLVNSALKFCWDSCPFYKPESQRQYSHQSTCPSSEKKLINSSSIIKNPSLYFEVAPLFPLSNIWIR